MRRVDIEHRPSPALVLRADVAIAMGDDAMARELLDRVAATPLTDAERIELADSLARAADLCLALD